MPNALAAADKTDFPRASKAAVPEAEKQMSGSDAFASVFGQPPASAAAIMPAVSLPMTTDVWAARTSMVAASETAQPDGPDLTPEAASAEVAVEADMSAQLTDMDVDADAEGEADPSALQAKAPLAMAPVASDTTSLPIADGPAELPITVAAADADPQVSTATAIADTAAVTRGDTDEAVAAVARPATNAPSQPMVAAAANGSNQDPASDDTPDIQLPSDAVDGDTVDAETTETTVPREAATRVASTAPTLPANGSASGAGFAPAQSNLPTGSGDAADPLDGLAIDTAQETATLGTTSRDVAPPAIDMARSTAALPQRVTEQVVRLLQNSADPRNGADMELRLDPPELGRVRISFSGLESALTATISVERPEVEAMLRRHIGELQRSLAEAGFDGASLNFASHTPDRDTRPQAPSGPVMALESAPVEQTPTAPPPRRNLVDGQLDIRL